MPRCQSSLLRRYLPGLLAPFLVLTLCGLSSAAVAQEYHQKFRVATFNVRHVTSDDTGDYSWANRQAGVFEAIHSNNPDVFGVQEASNSAIINGLIDEFGDDYGYHRPAVGGSPKLIFYRKSRFERLSPDQKGNFYLDNPYSDTESCHSNAGGRTVAWVKLRDRQSDRVYMIINLHTAHAKKCWKARNAAAERIHELLAEHADSGATFVMMGDFNMDEQSVPAGDSRDQMTSILEESKSGYRMRMSARHTGSTSSSTRTYNSTWKHASSAYSRLDYILVNSFDATTYRQAVDRRSIHDLLGSGADISPSDHFLVRAEIRQAPFMYHSVVSNLDGGTSDHYSFGDIDGDGNTDLILWKSTFESGRVRVHLADGDGGFESTAKIDSNTGVAGEWRFFADIDGDRCAERISWSRSIDGGALRVGKSNCDGTFEASETSNPGSTQASTQWKFARLNDDACMDRIAWSAETNGGKTRVAPAKCDGTLEFGPERINSDGGNTTNPGADLSFADVDGDGLDDKILWDLNLRGGRTTVYASQGDGSFALLAEHSGGYSGNPETQFYFGDTNGDGRAEKIFWRYNYHQGFLKMYPGGADGFVGHPMVVNNGPSTDDETAYHLADVNGDGSDDLIRWNRSEAPGKLRVYRALIVQEQPDITDPEDPDAGSNNDADAASDTVDETPDSIAPDSSTTDDIASADVRIQDTQNAAPDTENTQDLSNPNSTNTQLTGNVGCGCSSGDSGPSDLAAWLSVAVFVLAGRLFGRERGSSRG